MAGLEGRLVTPTASLSKLRQLISGLDGQNSLGSALANIQEEKLGFADRQAIFNLNAGLSQEAYPFVGTEIIISNGEAGPEFQQALRTQEGYATDYILVTYSPIKKPNLHESLPLYLREILIDNGVYGRLILSLNRQETSIEQIVRNVRQLVMHFEEGEEGFVLTIKNFSQMKEELTVIFPNELTFLVDK